MKHSMIVLALLAAIGCTEKPPERVSFHVCCNNSEHEDPTIGYRCRAANYVNISSRVGGMQIRTEDAKRDTLESFVLPHESFCVIAEGLDQYQHEVAARQDEDLAVPLQEQTTAPSPSDGFDLSK